MSRIHFEPLFELQETISYLLKCSCSYMLSDTIKVPKLFDSFVKLFNFFWLPTRELFDFFTVSSLTHITIKFFTFLIHKFTFDMPRSFGSNMIRYLLDIITKLFYTLLIFVLLFSCPCNMLFLFR